MSLPRKFNQWVGFVLLAGILGTGAAFGQSRIAYTVGLGGDNHADQWKAGLRPCYTDGPVFDSNGLVNWHMVVEASGIHSRPGHPSDGYMIYGAANVVFDLELHHDTESGPLATDAVFLSTINDGTGGDPLAPAAFAVGYCGQLNGVNGRLIDTVTWGGPRMSVHMYPRALPGQLVGQGAGYPEWNRTGDPSRLTTPGVGMGVLPTGQPGLGMVPLFEGQIDMRYCPLGTYVLKVIPAGGNNVLRGDVDMSAAVDRSSFAVAVNETTGDAITFSIAPPPAGVVGRHLFYNNSCYDGNTPGFTLDDYHAIAPDKVPLLPGGGPADGDNYSTYSRSINGILVDAYHFDRLPVWGTDLYCVTGNDWNDPFSWTDEAPPPSFIMVRPGEGVQGSDRLVLIWPDNAIPNTRWLLVGLSASDPSLGIPVDDYFIFGIAICDSNSDGMVSPTDQIAIRSHWVPPIPPVPITDPYDCNKDCRVSPTDEILARQNPTTPINRLKMITW